MLKLIFWVAVLVLALSFFGISIQAIVNSPTGQENFGYLYNLLLVGWRWIANAALAAWHWILGVLPF